MAAARVPVQSSRPSSSLIHRTLRGRALYVGVGLLALVFVFRAASLRPAIPHELVTADQAQQLEWWPRTLDRDALRVVLRDQPGLVLALSLLTFVIAGLAIGGFLITLVAIRRGRVLRAFRVPPHALPGWSVGDFGRIFVLTVLVVSILTFARFWAGWALPGGGDDLHLWMTASMLFIDVWLILAVLAFSEGKGLSVARTFGFVRRSLGPSLRTALRGYVAAFPWLFVLLFVIVELMRALGWQLPVEPIHQLLFERHSTPAVLWLTVLLACVIGPVAEELLFRGVLYSALRRRITRTGAMLASGAAFAFVHTSPIGFLPIMALGYLLAHLYERTGTLLAPMAVHILHNTLLMSAALVIRALLFLSG